MHRQSCKYYHFPGRTFVLFSCYILSSHHFVSKFNRSGRGERTIQKRSGVLPGLITMKNKWCKWTPWWPCVTGAIKAMDAQYIFRIDSCYCGHSFLPYFSFSSNGALDSIPILFDCWWERLSCFRKYRGVSKEGGRQHADQQAKDAQSIIATISNDLIRDLLTDLNWISFVV